MLDSTPHDAGPGARAALAQRVLAFGDRWWWFGPLVWCLALEYYAIQVVVANAWPRPYSVSDNTISDLGSTARLASGLLLSPKHILMDAGFIVLGMVMLAGAPLLYQEFRERRRVLAALGFAGVAMAGLGTVIVGLNPVNLRPAIHDVGAACPFFVGNAALIALAVALDRVSGPVRVYTGLSGGVALLALPLFLLHGPLGLPEGLTERFVAYPQTCWLMFSAVTRSGAATLAGGRLSRAEPRRR